MLSIYQHGARALHRFAHITGDGPHALVIRCTMQGRIHLFPTYEQAEYASHKRCAAINCTMRHTVESLQPVAVPCAQVPMGFADWKD